MNGIMNEKVIAKEYDFNKPLIQKIDSITDKCIRNCHDIYFHTFDHICEYDLNFTNISNNETVNSTVFDKSMGLYQLNGNVTLAREKTFIFNQIKNFEKIIYSNLSHINIHYYLKLRIPMCQKRFFRKLAQNHEYIQLYCNDRRNPFHFACRQ